MNDACRWSYFDKFPSTSRMLTELLQGKTAVRAGEGETPES